MYLMAENIIVNSEVDAKYCDMFTIIRDFYFRSNRPEFSKVQIKVTLILKDNKQFGPRRLGFIEKEKFIEIEKFG